MAFPVATEEDISESDEPQSYKLSEVDVERFTRALENQTGDIRSGLSELRATIEVSSSETRQMVSQALHSMQQTMVRVIGAALLLTLLVLGGTLGVSVVWGDARVSPRERRAEELHDTDMRRLPPRRLAPQPQGPQSRLRR